jgi:hypothetical protein
MENRTSRASLDAWLQQVDELLSAGSTLCRRCFTVGDLSQREGTSDDPRVTQHLILNLDVCPGRWPDSVI